MSDKKVLFLLLLVVFKSAATDINCSFYVKATQDLAPIVSKKWHLWDNWLLWDKVNPNRLHRFSMAAPKSVPIPLIDEYARWLHFYSDDEGKTWKGGGEILSAKKNQQERAVWSGSIRQNEEGKFWGAYTALLRSRKVEQGIGLAFWDEKTNKLKQQKRLLIDPRRDNKELLSLGYALESAEKVGLNLEADGSVLALRDPFIYGDTPEEAEFYFAAKAKNESGEFVPAIGRFRAVKVNGEYRAKLLSPLTLPDAQKFKQAELPNVFDIKGKKYLLISTTNRLSQEHLDHESDLHSRLYRIEGEKLIPQGRLQGFDDSFYGAQLAWPRLDMLSSFYHRSVGEKYKLSLPALQYFSVDNQLSSDK